LLLRDGLFRNRLPLNMNNAKTLIFIPTYNEAHNVENMCREIMALGLDADLLFCDDNSPDGTGAIIERLAIEFPRLRAMHREGKLGIGSAHQDGIRYAYEQGYETLLTMDCDFTHQPADVRRVLEASRGQPVTVASRYMRRNSLPNWNLLRRSLTHLGHFLTVNLLHLPQDATGALRAYRLDQIPREIFDLVRSGGYSFFFESLFVLHRNGFAIHEVPIALPARTYGHSKMTIKETLRSASRLMKLYRANLLHPEQFLLCPPIEIADGLLEDPQGWDAYWTRGQESARTVYAFIASVYRRLTIRRNLDFFIHKHFAPGARLLHAGCGSGQVDQHLSEEMKITAVDISMPALESYRRNNPHAASVKRADILHLDFQQGSFDGAYNLGVVEHFTSEQIQTILGEMARVVKPGGKIVIFWPHRWATSVWVLKGVHWLLGRLSRRPVQLHPPEISLLKSRQQAREAVEKAGFNMVDYYFGAKDLLIQAVVVGQKI
jgi:dolichol-phosphate mannosyltransferase